MFWLFLVLTTSMSESMSIFLIIFNLYTCKAVKTLKIDGPGIRPMVYDSYYIPTKPQQVVP